VTVRVRLVLMAAGVAGLAALLLWGTGGLRPFGHGQSEYAAYLNANAVHQRHATNVVSAVTFDYRGFDTLGEEFILFAAVMGVTLLLRSQRDDHDDSPRDRADGRRATDTSDAVRISALGLIGPSVLLGLYVVAHGTLTPGGGFQGGVVLAAAPLLLYLSGRYLLLKTVHPMHALDLAEGTGAGGFTAVALMGAVVGAAVMANFIGKGQVGSVFSGGTLPVFNVLVGLEVMAGLTLVLYEFLEQTLVVRRS
jgi:multicomponent Na+:H+ antiporter subunit B